jgi:thioredoxin-related protein
MKSSLLFLLLTITSASFAQLDTMRPAYQRYPTVPSLQLILADSVTKYTKANLPKNKAVLIMLFSPDCEHCKQEAEQIAARNEEFKNIHIIMATTYPLYRMQEFSEAYNLGAMRNVVVAKDHYYLLPPFYDIRNFPFAALYTKKGDLIKVFEGSVGVDKILAAFKQGK